MLYPWFLEDSKSAFGQQRSYLALELFAMQDDLEEVKDHIMIMQEICWESEMKTLRSLKSRGILNSVGPASLPGF